MTSQQINALSGRELDAAVAEHVMGARWISYPSSGAEYLYLDIGSAEMVLLSRNIADLVPEYNASLPAYSSDISSAFEVVEKMKERGWKFQMSDGMFGLGWQVAFYRGSVATFHEPAKTAPEAISRAALIAHFTEKGGEGA